jgi:hypothetical protein
MVSAVPFIHERAALYAVMDQFMEAIVARDPGRLRWAEDVRSTENNVALMIGDGLWEPPRGGATTTCGSPMSVPGTSACSRP